MTWIPVSERLPEREECWGKPMAWSVPVLVAFSNGQQAVAIYIMDRQWWVCRTFQQRFLETVTHWIPLPEGPQ